MVSLRKKAPMRTDENAGNEIESNLGYEEARKRRIEENKQRMRKLGILDLTQKLKCEIRPPKRSSANSPKKKAPASPLMMRSSSRLKSKPSVNYSEIREKNKRKEVEKDVVIRIKKGERPEIYTEEDQKLLGDCESVWTLGVDGFENRKRIYDPVNGKSCHQCRQKTLGKRTSCSKCGLGQGQFCGDCLYMRYGENVEEVNQNPNWVCPACRDICNCSFCRQEKGWAPTGNLYRKVLKLGYKSVAHYLIQSGCSQGINVEEEAAEALNSMLKAQPAEKLNSDNHSMDQSSDEGSSSTADSKTCL